MSAITKQAAAPPDPPQSFTIICYVCGISILCLFGGMALLVARRKQASAAADTRSFITARASQPMLRVAWSFYAASIGAWAIFLPPAYTSFGGWLSIITYAFSTGLPLLLIAEFGAVILKRIPDVLSLNDFAGRMYGRSVQLFVVVLSLVNMTVSLIAEYTAIGDLFEHYVGGERISIIIVVGVITAMYTASGGLLVSIVTDRAQAIMSLLLILIASIYLASEFRQPLRTPLPSNLGVNYAGLSSCFSLPISLLSSAIYSEAFWQRCWAAEDPYSLRWGAMVGFVLTTVVIGFFGLVGFIGLWAGLPPLDENNNLAFFVPFSDAATQGGKEASTGAMVVRVLLVLLATTMNESAVDSLQNAIVATLSSTFFVDKPTSWSRVLVFLVNAPIVVVALQGYALLDLFLAMNILTTTSTFPLLSALWLPGVSATTVFLSSFISLFCTCLLGVLTQGGDVAQGLKWTFTSQLNLYDYRIFLVAALTSVAAVYLSWLIIDTKGKGLRNFARRIDPALEPLLCCVSPRSRGASASSSRASSRHHESPPRLSLGGEQELSPSKMVRINTYDSLDTRATYDDETTHANAEV